ncbi:hypothetical protein WDU94_010050 [Cyamophila willieti]
MAFVTNNIIFIFYLLFFVKLGDGAEENCTDFQGKVVSPVCCTCRDPTYVAFVCAITMSLCGVRPSFALDLPTGAKTTSWAMRAVNLSALDGGVRPATPANPTPRLFFSLSTFLLMAAPALYLCARYMV